MTDERQGEALWRAIRQLPRGSGIVFRHHSLPPRARRALFDRVRRAARARRLTLVLAGTARRAAAWCADGVHGDVTRVARPLLRIASAHDAAELVVARRGPADLIFLSPIFATRTHPGARVLGTLRFGTLARGQAHIVALGGMDSRRARQLAALGSYGWAAIDGLTPGAR
jgi:thiamine-phosphate pyrophosphorylase